VRRLSTLRAWLWRRLNDARGLFARNAARRRRAHDEHGDREARARFWAEFRAGQNEAEARGARRKP
jgi:hypothetical protein